jgi:hypothetical protein
MRVKSENKTKSNGTANETGKGNESELIPLEFVDFVLLISA